MFGGLGFFHPTSLALHLLGIALDPAFEVPDELAHGVTQHGQLVHSKNEHHDQQDDQQLPYAESGQLNRLGHFTLL